MDSAQWSELDAEAVQFLQAAAGTVVVAAACLVSAQQQLLQEEQQSLGITVVENNEELSAIVQEAKPRKSGKMRMVAHRGSSHTAPENTLASMKLAFAQGASGVEFDIQKSVDGEIFLLHDDTLRRTACPTRPLALQHLSQEEYEAKLDTHVSELSYHDFIRHVDVGSWKGSDYAGEHPCLMTDAMTILPKGCFVLCEVKGGDKLTAQAVTCLAQEQGWTRDELTFIGFDLELMTEVKARLTNLGMPSIDVIYVQEGMDEVRAMEHIKAAKAAGLDGVDFEADPNVVTANVVQMAAEMCLQIGVWVWDALPNSDTHPTAEQLELCGVDFFTSDLPPPMREWICAY